VADNAGNISIRPLKDKRRPDHPPRSLGAGRPEAAARRSRPGRPAADGELDDAALK